MGVFEEEKEKFEHLVEQIHLLGISGRKIDKLSRLCFGIPVPKERVGKIYKEFADKEEFQINTKPLSDEYEYILLDGIWEKTKGYGWEENKSVLLCALGVKPNGQRQIIGFTLARAEDILSWEKLIKDMQARGLTGKSLRLAITDDNAALKTVLRLVYPVCPQQVCIVHKMRSVFTKTSFKNRRLIVEDLKQIFASQKKEEAILKTKAVVKKWYMVEPKAMESLRSHIEDCFTYLSFPKEIWSKIRTTNVLEREFREVRRRMKVFDNTFQNEESTNRYANSIISYLNGNYPLRNKLHTNARSGFAYHKIITDASGKPIDYEFIDVNEAFEKIVNLKKSDILRKRVTQVLPGIEKDPAGWIDKYGQVALKGKEIQFENFSEPLKKWFMSLSIPQ